MTNKQLARRLQTFADLVELTGGNAFRARALASAARAVDRLREPVAARVADGSVTAVPGIGKGIARDLAELVETGRLAASDALLASLPPGLPEVLRVKGLGVRKVRALWTEAGVTSLDELEAAAVSGRLAALDGFGAKTATNVLASIAQLRAYRGRRHLRDAVVEAAALVEGLAAFGIEAEIAGEIRRQCNVVAEVRLVARASADALAAVLPDVSRDDGVLRRAEADGFASVVVPAEHAFGRTLWEHTGPSEHVEAVAARLGGAVPGDERAIYDAAGLAFVPPPLRDDPHWLGVAENGPLPRLVAVGDLVGTIHNHTTASDGSGSLDEMVAAADARGLTYFGVCDHSQSLRVAHGLSPERLAEQRRAVDDLNRKVAEGNARGGAVRVFAGSEVDILADGSLDFDDETLDELDLVVASVHQGFAMSADEATARVTTALATGRVDVLGHPTARLLLRREGYPLDHAAVLDACAAHGVAVELNANPWRLDLDWRWVRHAVDRGVPVAINPDAHSPGELDNVRWGVLSAQKGGLTAADSLTSRDADAFAAWLAARRR